MRNSILSFAVALILTAPLLAQPLEPQVPKTRLVTKVFSVADLVVPIPDATFPGQAENVALAEKWKKPTTAEAGVDLVRQVTGVVRPQSWDSMGGVGKINFYEKGLALVVINTPDVVAAVGEYIEGMRKLQDVNVSIAVRYVKLPVGMAGKVLQVKGDAPVTFDEKQTAKLLEVLQANPACSVMQAPKVTLFNGQVGTIMCAERRSFVTGLEAVSVNGNAVLVPKNTAIDLGDTITVCGRVSADERYVSLKINATRAGLASEQVELVPVTTQIAPIADGPKGKPIPFTQYLQLPRVKTDTVQQLVTLPSGRTVVVGSWTISETTQTAVPVLGELPLVGGMFKNTVTTESEVVILATVNVIRTEQPAK